MKKIQIKGKDYVPVNERVIHFRQNFGDKKTPFGLNTHVVQWDVDNKQIIIQAVITDQADRVVGSGIAHEWQDDPNSFVNSTSYVENCETSAIGRALASIGIGVEDAYASANEVEGAVSRQRQQKHPKPKVKAEKPNVADEMVTESTQFDSSAYLENYKLQLTSIFCESEEHTDEQVKKAFIDNVNCLGKTNGNQIIYDFAARHPDNKNKLKAYAEINSMRWQATLTKDDGQLLIAFMTYLNDKFPKEVA